MWTDTTRAQHARSDLALPSDLTDGEWAALEPFLPPPSVVGRPRKWPLRRILEAILYLLRGGLPWRMLPPCFPPVSTVRRWFYTRGEPRVCSMVRIPTPEEEDRRRIGRERKALVAERILHVNRMKGLLFSQGIRDYEPLNRDRRKRLDELRTGDGRELPGNISAQVCRELDRLELLLDQIKAVEGERDAMAIPAGIGTPAPMAMLLGLKGIGPEFAAILYSEGLFRHFDNRRQVAAYAGLAPSPWQSGSIDREQGVSKAGNPRLRTTMVQLAWLWLRHQPDSTLARWFQDRVIRNGGRLKKAMIVALARKLLVALWKFVTSGVVIEGAAMKPTG